jgi:hypothetical protein
MCMSVWVCVCVYGRGLRLKVGVDVGRLRGEINCITGRMSYRGRGAAGHLPCYMKMRMWYMKMCYMKMSV